MNRTIDRDRGQTQRPPEPNFWGKIDILLKPIGSIVTALIVGFISYLGSNLLQERQQIDAKVRLYAQIMSSREASETGLRREMFNSIIRTFLQSGVRKAGSDDDPRKQLEQRILAVQLLTYNFHDALDLGPLFKYLEREIGRLDASEDRKTILSRLKRTAKDVVNKQLALLETDGESKVGLFELSLGSKGEPHIDEVLANSVSTDSAVKQESSIYLEPKHFYVEMIKWNLELEEVKVRLKVTDPKTGNVEIDEVFWVGAFDFPLIDNARLRGGGRCAVVLQKFTNDEVQDENTIYGMAKLKLVYFHGSRASLRSRPYYDEVIREAVGNEL